jgi:hypothetical protein
MKVQKVLSTTLAIIIFNPLVAWASSRDDWPRNMTCRVCVQQSLPPRPPQTPPPQRTQPTPQGTQPTPPRTQPTPPQPRSGR